MPGRESGKFSDPAEEMGFQIWYGKWAKRFGMNSDPDHPNHFYDYRGAFKDGVGPTYPEDGRPRWPDKYKKKGSPY